MKKLIKIIVIIVVLAVTIPIAIVYVQGVFERYQMRQSLNELEDSMKELARSACEHKNVEINPVETKNCKLVNGAWQFNG